MKRSLWRIARELLLLAVLYVGYSAARLLASDDTALAIQHAKDVLGVERWWHIGVELSWNSFLAEHEFLSVLAGYWYASMHYIVTPLVLVLLWRHSHAHYIKMRRVLVGATTIALGAYIFYPTAPPRIMDGYVDILAVHHLTREATPGALHDLDGHVYARFGVDGTAHYLIRPDGHIGYRCGGTDLDGLRNYLTRWLPNTTSRPA